MNRSDLIQYLIFVLVVSLAIAGVFAVEAVDILHHYDTTKTVDGPHVSVSGNSIHVLGHNYTFNKMVHIDTIPRHMHY